MVRRLALWPLAAGGRGPEALGLTEAPLLAWANPRNGSFFLDRLAPPPPEPGPDCPALAAAVAVLSDPTALPADPALRGHGLLDQYIRLINHLADAHTACPPSAALERALFRLWGRRFRAALLGSSEPRARHMCACAFPFNFQ